MEVLGKLILFLLLVSLSHPSFFNGPSSMHHFQTAWANLFHPELVAAFWVCPHPVTMAQLMQGNWLAGVISSGFFSSWLDNIWCFCFPSLLAYTEQYLEYDPFLVPPDPSNPWISDDTTFWELEARYTILFLHWM